MDQWEDTGFLRHRLFRAFKGNRFPDANTDAHSWNAGTGTKSYIIAGGWKQSATEGGKWKKIVQAAKRSQGKENTKIIGSNLKSGIKPTKKFLLK